MNRTKLICIAVLTPVIAIILLIGWLLISFYKADHTDEIASAILFGRHESQDYQTNYQAIDELNDAVLNAALSKRFQPDSNPMEAQVFFEKLGGTCKLQLNKSIFCHLPKNATICGSFWIEISIDVATDGGLKSIFAKPRSLFC